MTFINYFSEKHEEFEPKFKVGDTAITTKPAMSLTTYIPTGSIVKVTGISWRGYDIEDSNGVCVSETGWDSIA